MTSKPVVSVYISVAHMIDGTTTIVHASAYAVDIPESITLEDAQLAATVAARKFGVALNDRLGDMAEHHRVVESGG